MAKKKTFSGREHKGGGHTAHIDELKAELADTSSSPPQEKLVRLNIQVSPETRQQLKIASAREGISMRELVDRLLKEYLQSV